MLKKFVCLALLAILVGLPKTAPAEITMQVIPSLMPYKISTTATRIQEQRHVRD